MRGRIAVALVVGLGLFVGGGAGAQTTTSSSSTTSSSTTSSTAVVATTSPQTTSTTLAHPCTGQPCTAEPPGAVLSTQSRELVPDRGSYCWREPTGESTVCLALAIAPGYQPPILLVTQGELVTVRFTAPVAMTPLEVVLHVPPTLARSSDRITLPASNPTTFRVDLPPGIHDEVRLDTRWLQGQVPYFFRLDVRSSAPPATPVVRDGLTLTG